MRGTTTLAVLLAITACSHASQNAQWGSFDSRVIEAFVGSGAEGVLTGFKAAPGISLSDLQLSLKLREGQPLVAEYMLLNSTATALDITTLCFIDYRQISFRLGNRDARMHHVHLRPGERLIRRFEIRPVEKGAHDLLILGVTINKAGEQNDASPYFPLVHRANLFVESETFPQYRCQNSNNDEVTIADESRSPSQGRAAVAISPRLFKQGPLDDALYLRFGNPHTVSVSFATLLLADGKQISTRSTKLDELQCSNLGPYASLEQQLVPEVEKRSNRLFAVTVESPFMQLESRPGVMAQVPTAVRISNTYTSVVP